MHDHGEERAQVPTEDHGESSSSMILTGLVSYRFHLRQSQENSKNGTSASGGRKRARPDVDHDDAVDDDDTNIFLADPDASLVGFVLHDEARDEDFLLSVPQHLQVPLGQAASKGWRVQVSADCVYDVGRSSSLHDKAKAEGVQGFVETSNLQILSTHDDSDDPRSFLSLAQVRRVEELDRSILGKVAKTTTKRWDVQATVRAVSPILAADPDDPYCLVELLDVDALCSGVAIVRQNALVHHMSIVPGQTLCLCRARRRAWNVHETLHPADDARPQQLPSKVLLVEQADQIIWRASAHALGETFKNPLAGEPCPTTVSGEVARIRTIKSRKDDKSPVAEHLHSIELVASPTELPSSHPITLFVTYFPLPTSLLLSIRQGARILANNVRPMPFTGSHCYCATLRSHISLLSFAPMRLHGSQPAFTASDMAIAAHPCRPPSARLSYDELWARRAVAPLVDPWRAPPVHDGTPIFCSRPPCPDLKDVADAYLRSTGTIIDKQRISGAAQRDKNAEFFLGDFGALYQSSLLPGTNPGGPGALPVVRIPLKIEGVYGAAIQALHEILDDHVKSTSCSFGFMGSIHRTGRDLLPTLGMKDGVFVDERARPVFLGLASSMKDTAGLEHAIVSGQGAVSVPCALRLPKKLSHGNSQFIFATVQSFVVSFLCLGVGESSITPHPSGGYQLQNPGAASNAYGTCQILVVHDLVFLVSLRLECSDVILFDSRHCKESGDVNEDPTTSTSCSMSLQECLTGPPRIETKFFSGLLTLKFLRAFKAANGNYNGCALLLAHLPSDTKGMRVDKVSGVQSSELKLSIPVDNPMFIQLRRRLVSTARLGLQDKQLVVACIWWQIALQAPLLLDGGWDELVTSGSEVAVSTGVVVRAPVSSVKLDPARGYVRMACQLNDLAFKSVQLRPCSSSSDGARFSVHSIDFLAKKRTLPGDLSSRAKRRLGSPTQGGQYVFGELQHPVSECAGVPLCTIADLFGDLVADLASTSRAHLAPSLVREIRSAKLLSVSYCQVIAECPSCFKSLVAPKVISGIQGRISGSGETSLRCPGQCPSGSASVKWECSGTLDDGTGQAKLYAEREAALVLLGMSVADARDVEAAALSRPGGLVYSRGLPPRSDLVVALDTARHRALQKLHGEWAMGHQQHHRLPRTRISECDVMNCLSDYDRGDLVLQRHCRCSRVPTRDLVYYVRCKPVSDEVLQRGILNLSEIDVLRPGIGGGRATVSKDVATYSLPPVKLVLVDVASPANR